MNAQRNDRVTPAILGLAMFALSAAALTFSVGSTPAIAQVTDVPIVGFVSPQSRDAQTPQVEAFLRGMAELGYVDGENVRYEWRFADGDRDLRAPLMEEMVALQPDVIVTPPGMRIIAAEATPTIPLVVANMSPSALADVMALPNTNITGTTRLPGAPGSQDRLALAMELVPDAASVGYLLNTSVDDGGVALRQEFEEAAAALGINLIIGEAASVEEIPVGAQALVDQGVGALVYGTGGMFSVGRDQFIEVTTRARAPTVFNSKADTAQGGLVALGANNDVTFHGAAALVDQILKGASPADVPFAEFETAWLAVNLAAAEEIGFRFPPAVLERANEVIE